MKGLPSVCPGSAVVCPPLPSRSCNAMSRSRRPRTQKSTQVWRKSYPPIDNRRSPRMRSQKRLRDELRFITEFNTLCDVIQQSAVSQLGRADARAVQQPLLMEILRREFLPLVPASAAAHPLVHGGVRGHLLVVFTSDEGLVGPRSEERR